MTAQQLKNSILQMAVQGKLVPQIPSDEPASVLLERIRAEKEKLIKAGKIKKEKNPSVIFRGSDNLPYEKTSKGIRCIADEIPFEIPDSWEWCRCTALFQINPRHTMPDEMLAGFMSMPMLQEGFQNSHSFEMRRWSKIKNGFTHFQNGDIVIAKITPCFQNRKSAIISGLPNDCGAGSTELHVLRDVTGFLFMPFFLWIFKTHLFIEDGKKHFTGTAGQQRIGKDFISTYLIPLPPLFEQERIVAKIEELLPHLKDYDQAETQVSKLNTEFPEQLKKSILQWAIQGKLVPQNPDDEPASVLLDRIRAKKAKLITEGKIKKDKVESVIFRRDNSHYTVQDGKEVCLDDTLPFDIPLSWSWVKLKELLEQASTGPFGSMLHKSDYVDSGVPLVNPANIVGTQISDVGIKKVSVKTAEELRSYKLFPGDVIIGRRGELGRSAVVPDNAAGWLCGTGCFFVTTNATLLPAYLVFLLASPYIREALLGKAVGTTMNNLNHGILGDLLVPLPPKQEQHRILMQWDVLIKRFFA